MTRLADIVRDPEYAGLHWSIPRDTPDALRESAHIAAANAAKWRREQERARPVCLAYNPATRQKLLLWANASRTWVSEIEIADERIVLAAVEGAKEVE